MNSVAAGRTFGGIFDLDALKARIGAIEREMADSNFWADQTKAQQTVQTLKSLKARLEPIETVQQGLRDVEELLALVDAQDGASLSQLGRDLTALEERVGQVEIQRLLGEEHDPRNAILSLHAGAGGTESCDWAEMLLRMYRRWADERGFTTELIDLLPGEEAGVKTATVIIKGPYAYGYLKAEEGVHRLVRISPFDANKRRHTSFASVDVIPEIDDAIEVQVNTADLRIDTYRSSGKGGQHVNMTDSAVRITHLPTGLVVQCQDERSQHQNKAKALQVLRSRLYQLELAKREAAAEADYQAKQKIEWGSQIRSYVLHPYRMVKDLRTDYETGNADAILDGKLDPLIEAYLKWRAGRG
ncbi:MAG: peptide chain release factor 2 [Candidatus Omnitrophica bacterium]|nr:peptide chain release factor 2 [Candidatus Omnitrophota bacterium]